MGFGEFRCCEFRCFVVRFETQSFDVNDGSHHDGHENDRDDHVSVHESDRANDLVDDLVDTLKLTVTANTTADPSQQAMMAYPIVLLFEFLFLDLIHFIFFVHNLQSIILLPQCSQLLFRSIVQDQPRILPL